VTAIHGGTTTNIVTRECDSYVEGLALADVQAVCAKHQEKTGVEFTAVEENGLVHVHTLGVSAHAASPEGGKNAQIAMVGMLADLPLAQSRGQKAICDLARLFPFGDNYGAAMGVNIEDEKSGKLTLVFSKLQFSLTGFEAQFDSRCPICATEATVKNVVEKQFADCQFEFIARNRMSAPHYTPEDSPLVQTLLKTYERYTGLKGECLAIGGGTYVHDIEGGVAFGCALPGTDNRMHGADEFAVIDELMVSAKMFTQIILELCE
jgi:succinyl-diaminopimelate desuccinylase